MIWLLLACTGTEVETTGPTTEAPVPVEAALPPDEGGGVTTQGGGIPVQALGWDDVKFRCCSTPESAAVMNAYLKLVGSLVSFEHDPTPQVQALNGSLAGAAALAELAAVTQGLSGEDTVRQRFPEISEHIGRFTEAQTLDAVSTEGVEVGLAECDVTGIRWIQSANQQGNPFDPAYGWHWVK